MPGSAPPTAAALVGAAGLSQVVKADVERDDFSPTQRSSYLRVCAEGAEQLGACLAAYPQVSDANTCVRVALHVLGVAGHLAPARADPRCQGVAKGHVVPTDSGICHRGIPGTVARSRGLL
jgi:hypothetical protein